MPELTPREAGRLWELRWVDFPPADVSAALEARREALPLAQQHTPIVGVWTVDVGANLGRIYTLFAYRDAAHRDTAQAALAATPGWPPRFDVTPTGRGTKLLEPSHFSPLR